MPPTVLLPVAGFQPDRLIFPGSWCGHIPFAAWVINEVKPPIFVELGTHTGNSYFTFCQSVRQHRLETRCFAVDTWQGDDHMGAYGDGVYPQVRDYHDPRFASFSRLLRMTFDAARDSFADGSVGLLHIDGLHTYDAVRHDFETWRPKLAPGAVVLFHDTQVRAEDFGVIKYWRELQRDYPHHLEFPQSYGLGVLQVDPAPEQIYDWLVPNSMAQKKVLRYFQLAARKLVGSYRLREMAHRRSRPATPSKAAPVHTVASVNIRARSLLRKASGKLGNLRPTVAATARLLREEGWAGVKYRLMQGDSGQQPEPIIFASN